MVAVVLLSSLLTAVYLFKVLEQVYLRPAKPEPSDASRRRAQFARETSAPHPVEQQADASRSGAGAGGPSGHLASARACSALRLSYSVCSTSSSWNTSCCRGCRERDHRIRPAARRRPRSGGRRLARCHLLRGAGRTCVMGGRRSRASPWWSSPCVMLTDTLDGRIHRTVLLELSPGIDIALRADPAGMIFGLLVSVLWVLAGRLCGWLYARRTRAEADAFLCCVRAEHRCRCRVWRLRRTCSRSSSSTNCSRSLRTRW